MSNPPASTRDPASARVDYDGGGLEDGAIAGTPYPLLRQWYDEAAEVLDEPNAMVLSTVGADGAPHSRTVLLKGLADDGLVFFTNYGSAKAAELGENPRCALVFPWIALHRQVRVEGVAAKVERAESEAYFASRPRDAQLGAWASHQSSQVASRAELDHALAEVTGRFEGSDVPCPPFWGGYRVVPTSIEFWQGRRGRLHDRLLCVDRAGVWHVRRLAP